jgi:DNA ligase-1
MTIVKSSPVLEAKARTGQSKYWQGHVVQEGDQWFTQTSYWQKNKAGENTVVQFSTPYEAKPKNVGKGNEVTAEKQAHKEFDSMVRKQRDKGYIAEGAPPQVLPLPMLAQKFTERKHHLSYPVYVQPKYNGQRMLYDGEKGWSRGGKTIIPKVIAHLQFNTKGLTTDGELILPGNPKLQETMRAAKKYRPGISETLLYVLYDLVLTDPFFKFSERLEALEQLLWDVSDQGGIIVPDNVVIAPTYLAKDEDEIMIYHKQFVSDGYEGIIIRNDNEPYCIGQRSNQLQKYKTFVDCEFKIVGVKEGEGSFKGCACFQCINEEGLPFDCNPEGTMEYKKELWETRDSLIGKWLTVRYQERSSDNIPIFPVGVDIRAQEEANES